MAFLPIDLDIPLPTERSRTRLGLVDWEGMPVGGSTFLPDTETTNPKAITVQASTWGRKLGRRFVTRRMGGDLVRGENGMPLLDAEGKEQYTPLGTRVFRMRDPEPGDVT